MPLYEYLCESCGRTIEAIQSFAEPPLAVCDRCAGALKKLVSAPAFQFKGTGWYVSDYGRPSSSPSNSSDAPKTEGGAPKESSGSGDGAKESSKKETPGSGNGGKDPSKKDS